MQMCCNLSAGGRSGSEKRARGTGMEMQGDKFKSPQGRIFGKLPAQNERE